MVTVSTSNPEPRGYHHGDLREALLDAGLKALETTPGADISLRALAREVGVSPTAVYRHFPDKRALFAAFAQEGLRRLGEVQHAAMAKAGGAEGFAATGHAYVRFALDNPALFRLAFTHGSHGADPMAGDDPASALLRENALALAGGDPERARVLALQALSIAHGLAMLMLDGQLPRDDALIERVIDSETLFCR